MRPNLEIRADFDKNSIVVYQAFSKEIALPALKHNKFVPPFSFKRMTWIKPSFLWLMERSKWGTSPGQEYILAVRITRSGWEKALREAVLSTFHSTVYDDYKEWRKQVSKAPTRVQWDPERSIYGKKLQYRSIQVGLSSLISQQYVKEWIIEIKDYTALARKIHKLVQSGQVNQGKKSLPKENTYPLSPDIAKRIGII